MAPRQAANATAGILRASAAMAFAAILALDSAPAQSPAPQKSPPTQPPAQRRTPPLPQVERPPPSPGLPRPPPEKIITPQTPQITMAPEATETIQADVSSRTIAIEHDFAGARIILFGNIENSRQLAPESGLYDIVVVLEGPEEKIVVRKKDRKAGIWVNSTEVTFQEVPSFYGVVSTRPLDEITSEPVRDRYQIGFQNVYMELAPEQKSRFAPNQLEEFRQALVRLKQTQGLYREDQYGIAFIGKSLFRTNIYLPANVTVGTFRARVFLFRDGKFLSRYTAPLKLERAGIERAIHSFAFEHPLYYGVVSVLLAVGAGLAASVVFGKRAGH
jgi:uncharacterized protein (TIGR02186 family)